MESTEGFVSVLQDSALPFAQSYFCHNPLTQVSIPRAFSNIPYAFQGIWTIAKCTNLHFTLVVGLVLVLITVVHVVEVIVEMVVVVVLEAADVVVGKCWRYSPCCK